MTDYERGVEQAGSIYKTVIREYTVENAELRDLARDMYGQIRDVSEAWAEDAFADRLRNLGIEVGE